jgi:hypothetical protein
MDGGGVRLSDETYFVLRVSFTQVTRTSNQGETWQALMVIRWGRDEDGEQSGLACRLVLTIE